MPTASHLGAAIQADGSLVHVSRARQAPHGLLLCNTHQHVLHMSCKVPRGCFVTHGSFIHMSCKVPRGYFVMHKSEVWPTPSSDEVQALVHE